MEPDSDHEQQQQQPEEVSLNGQNESSSSDLLLEISSNSNSNMTLESTEEEQREKDFPSVSNSANSSHLNSEDSEEEEEDEDYVPGRDKSEIVSDDETEEKLVASTNRKRAGKANGGSKGKKRKRRKVEGSEEDDSDDEEDEDFTLDEEDGEEEEPEEVLDPEEIARREQAEKERTDKLWEAFLSDVEQTKAKRKEEKDSGFKVPAVPKTVTRVYDFAGEKVKVEEKVEPRSKETVNGSSSASVEAGSSNGTLPHREDGVKKPPRFRVSFLSGNPSDIGLAGGKSTSAKEGLANVLNALHARNKKLGTLDKSKLDWEMYKRDQNMAEELALHNRSKNGFIDRQEFLQRADVRQFEIEKAARTKRRKPVL